MPRIRLANLPTPLEEMPLLSERLGGPKLYIKRDDLTGLAFGGNKARKLEFIMAEAKRRGADVIVTGAGFQSNWCTQVAAAARKLGMKIVLVKSGPREGYDPEEYDGNQLLHFILGADIKIVTAKNIQRVSEEIFKKLKRNGHTPYFIPIGGSTPLGALGYVNAIPEILSQANNMKIKVDYIVTATGSTGTQAGLLLGAKAFNTTIKVLGFSVSSSKHLLVKRIENLINDTSKLLSLDLSITPEDIVVYDEYVGEGYGVINKDTVEAIKLVAETEGILLDPVYTGKAMAGLIDQIKRGRFTREETVVFLHSGGTAALFPYRKPIRAIIELKKPPWTKPPGHSPTYSTRH
jgi:D-cysteine desulfhydrase family pyridoxal phosphate-dependent enzyme